MTERDIIIQRGRPYYPSFWMSPEGTVVWSSDSGSNHALWAYHFLKDRIEFSQATKELIKLGFIRLAILDEVGHITYNNSINNDQMMGLYEFKIEHNLKNLWNDNGDIIILGE